MTNATLADEVLKRDALGRVRTPWCGARRWWRVADANLGSPRVLWRLQIELPGGSRMSVASPMQLPMAAELIAMVAQRTGSRC